MSFWEALDRIPRYGVRNRAGMLWLAHWSLAHTWSPMRSGRAVFTSRERALETRDCWRYRGADAVLVRLRPDAFGRYS